VADYRRVEQASIKTRVRLHSPDGKRLFVRFFHSLQLNAHFVSNIARAHLSSEDVERVEQTLRRRLDELMAEIHKGIEGAQALFAANGITRAATYDTAVLDLEVGVISSLGRRYLEAIQALDRLMPMLQTLEIYEVVSTSDLDAQRALYKKPVRRVVAAARELAKGLRKRINELAGKDAVDAGGAAPPAQPLPPDDRGQSGHSSREDAGEERPASPVGAESASPPPSDETAPGAKSGPRLVASAAPTAEEREIA
jgi:hypothetical protein